MDKNQINNDDQNMKGKLNLMKPYLEPLERMLEQGQRL